MDVVTPKESNQTRTAALSSGRMILKLVLAIFRKRLHNPLSRHFV